MALLALRNAQSSPETSLCTSLKHRLQEITGITPMRKCLWLMDFMEQFTSGSYQRSSILFNAVWTN